MIKRSGARRSGFGFSPTRSMTALGIMLLGLAVCFVGFRLIRADVSAEAYRRQLTTLASSYNDLRSTYNDAVRRMSVTELVVDGGHLSVQVRGADGSMRTIATPFDPSREIYVDYVVVDQRLWIRRVFDSHTAPSEGLIIEPSLVDVDWDDGRANHGKTVYRSLGEGRWVVDITRDGSLGLRRARDGESVRLVAVPELVEHEPIDRQVEESLRTMTLSDVWRALFGGP